MLYFLWSKWAVARMWASLVIQSFCFSNILEQNLTICPVFWVTHLDLFLISLISHLIDCVSRVCLLGKRKKKKKTMAFEKQKQNLILWWMVNHGPQPAVFLFPFCVTLPWESLFSFKNIPERKRTPVISLILPGIAAGL